MRLILAPEAQVNKRSVVFRVLCFCRRHRRLFY